MTIMLMSRWYYDTLDLLFLYETLAEAGINLERPLVALFSRLFLMIVGTISTVYFVYATSDSNKNGPAT